ncbi:hypothetical protein SAMN04488074_101482 [Lentzea albidocapillata subsp. violacea]|uniref:Uncharacterized protein n=1 Tax=Lentzea albidocapillata subsp. violacea TaxID=128104 RepID=A0A1G8QWH4_9PSEU|nr:hypothetical protein [Lentzea albidocapillata]SDJ09092.1 hypothetical protein SAMN04488074_101482 [Lentzea albidocapillata subsp. violacea]
MSAERDFNRYLNARMLSVVGAVVSAVALPVLVYRLTGSAAEALPYLLFAQLSWNSWCPVRPVCS